MNIKQEKQNDFAIIELDGEITYNNSSDLRKAFDELLEGDEKKVLIDLKDVGFIDSSGIATLVEFMQNLDDKGGKMYMVGVSEKIIGIIEITKLDKVFSIHNSREEVFSL